MDARRAMAAAAHGAPLATAELKAEPEDFRVEEELSFVPAISRVSTAAVVIFGLPRSTTNCAGDC